MPKYRADDLLVWLCVAKHLNNQEFINKYGGFSHEKSDKSHWRWIASLGVNVVDVQET